MKKLFFLFLLFLINQSPAFSQTDLTSDDWREDLDYLASELKHRHPNLFHNVNKSDFETASKQLYEEIPQLSDHLIIMQMTRLVAMVGEAHSYLRIPASGELAFHRYPIELKKFRDGVFITKAISEYKHLIGGRIVEIGETPVEEVWSQVAPFVNRDNEMTLEYLIPFRLTSPEVLHAAGIINEPGTVNFTIEKNNKRNVVSLSPGPYSPDFAKTSNNCDDSISSFYWNKSDKNYWFKIIPDYNSGYLQFNSVRNDPDLSFSAFTDSIETVLSKNTLDRIIIDLRRNTGGGWEMTIPLIQTLIRQNFHEYGKLYILTGPATISAATVFAVELGKWTNPIYIGQPSGSSPNQYGDIVFFNLPNSGLSVGYSAAFFQTAGYENSSPWIVPDIAIEMNSEDFFNCEDPVLPVALTHTPEKPISEKLIQMVNTQGIETVFDFIKSYRSDSRNQYQNIEKPVRQLGDYLIDNEKIAEAIRIHTFNTEIHPDQSRSYYGLAYAFEQTEQKQKALDMYKKALSKIYSDSSLYPALRIVLEAQLKEIIKELN